MTMTLLADVTLAVTLVLTLGALAGLLLRRGSPALRHAAWRATLAGVWLAPLLVVAQGLLPVPRAQIAVPLPRYGPAPAPEPAPMIAPLPGGGRSAPLASAPVLPTLESGRPRPDAVRPAPAPREPLPIAALVLGLWALGALVGLVLLGRDATALRGLLTGGAGVPAQGPPPIEALAERLGMARSPRVIWSERVAVPAVTEFPQPLLVLPSRARADEAALIHELAHLRRGDVAALGAARLTAALWWWHPLAWLLLRGLAASAEEACDDVVLALTGARREYARMLADWAEACATAGCVSCASRGRALVARVRRVLDERVRPVVALAAGTRAALLLASVVVIILAGTLHVGAGDAKAAGMTDADGITTVLLIGNDARPQFDDPGRADVMMLLFLNPETDRAALLSLPRDLRVEIPGLGPNKLNAAYPFGGSALVQQTIEGLLGITIDHHVTLNMARFPEVIDALGPVQIDVPDVEGRGRGMNYDDNWGGLHIHLQPGPQLLNGGQALGFVTYRTRGDDFSRQTRQQQFLQALIEQRLRADLDVARALPALSGAVETDLSAREMLALADALRDLPGAGGLLTADLRLRVRHVWDGGIYHVEIERADLVSVLAEVAGHLAGAPEETAFSLKLFAALQGGDEGDAPTGRRLLRYKLEDGRLLHQVTDP